MKDAAHHIKYIQKKVLQENRKKNLKLDKKRTQAPYLNSSLFEHRSK